MTEIKHKSFLTWTALFVAWSVDYLFWNKIPPALSFCVFVLVALAAGFLLLWRERIRPSLTSMWLVLLIVYLAAATTFRKEPMTVAVSIALVISCIILLTATLRNGLWLQYGVLDAFDNVFKVFISTMSGLPTLFSRRKGQVAAAEDAAAPAAPATPWYRRMLPVLRGLALAIPLVLILAGLLSSADPVFSRYWQQFIELFRIQKWPEYIARAIYISILFYLFVGMYWHALAKSQDETLLGKNRPLSSLLGLTEASIVLGSMNLLFISFVSIQVRYLFGGEANINFEGFTYAEYARRGFSELVAVAFISLLILVCLAAITRRSNPQQRRIFSGLGVLLVLLVIAILISSYQRLLMYETAYGFSRLRTYTHVFIIWLGLLLVSTIVFEILEKQRVFAVSLLLASLGFGITLSVMNVDGFIVRQNLARAQAGEKFDRFYVMDLSADAIPDLAAGLASLPPSPLRDQVGAGLACWRGNLFADPYKNKNWQSFHFSDYQAYLALKSVERQIDAYPLSSSNDEVTINGKSEPCEKYAYSD